MDRLNLLADKTNKLFLIWGKLDSHFYKTILRLKKMLFFKKEN